MSAGNLSPAPRRTDMQPQGGYKPASELDTLHETTDLDIRGLVGFTVGLVVMVALACFAMKLLMDDFAARSARFHEETALPPRFSASIPLTGPRLQADPSVATRSLEKSTRDWINSYAVVNPKEGIARIPIDRAMAILGERGLPEGGKVDEFHPKPGSSGVEKVGIPAPDPEPEAKPEPKP